jgi:hypothetical protein
MTSTSERSGRRSHKLVAILYMSDACYTADTSIAREKLLCLLVNKEALNNAAGRAVYTLLIAQDTGGRADSTTSS